jgi:hypothetical protein
MVNGYRQDGASMTTISLAAFARRHGVTPPAVQKWKKSGLIVIVDGRVDVEASDERLRLYRNEHDGRAQRGAKKSAARLGSAPTGLAQLTDGDILRRLEGLDWRHRFDWSDDAQADRARLAAQCIGMQAVESDRRDDGHWGGFQLRDPRWIRNGVVDENAILAGFGFEASPVEVLRVCRGEITPEDDGSGDFTCTVDLSLLHLLARPFHQHDRPDSETDAPGR